MLLTVTGIGQLMTGIVCHCYCLASFVAPLSLLIIAAASFLRVILLPLSLYFSWILYSGSRTLPCNYHVNSASSSPVIVLIVSYEVVMTHITSFCMLVLKKRPMFGKFYRQFWAKTRTRVLRGKQNPFISRGGAFLVCIITTSNLSSSCALT